MWLDPLNGRLSNAGAGLLFITPALIAISALAALSGLPPGANENGPIDSSAMLLTVAALLTIYLWGCIGLIMPFNAYGKFVREWINLTINKSLSYN